MNILFVGIAFKGEPETNDVRGSTSLDIKENLTKKVKKINGWDAVLTKDNIKDLGFNNVKNLDEGIKTSDIILILNNHRLNVKSNYYYKTYNEKLIFDGKSIKL